MQDNVDPNLVIHPEKYSGLCIGGPLAGKHKEHTFPRLQIGWPRLAPIPTYRMQPEDELKFLEKVREVTATQTIHHYTWHKGVWQNNQPIVDFWLHETVKSVAEAITILTEIYSGMDHS